MYICIALNVETDHSLQTLVHAAWQRTHSYVSSQVCG